GGSLVSAIPSIYHAISPAIPLSSRHDARAAIILELQHPCDLMLTTESRQRQSSAGARTDAIEIENVGKVFRTRLGTISVEALRDVSFSISPGQFVCFVGPSGCGKSTLLKLSAGLIELSSV